MTGMCSSPLGIHLVFIVFKYLMLYSLPKALQAYCFIAREHQCINDSLRDFEIIRDSARQPTLVDPGQAAAAASVEQWTTTVPGLDCVLTSTF